MGAEDFGGSDLPHFSMSKSIWHTKRRQTDRQNVVWRKKLGRMVPSLGSPAHLGTGFSSV